MLNSLIDLDKILYYIQPCYNFMSRGVDLKAEEDQYFWSYSHFSIKKGS